MRSNDVTCRMEKGVYFPLPMKKCEFLKNYFNGSIISEQLSAHWKVANTKKKKICDFM